MLQMQAAHVQTQEHFWNGYNVKENQRRTSSASQQESECLNRPLVAGCSHKTLLVRGSGTWAKL